MNACNQPDRRRFLLRLLVLAGAGMVPVNAALSKAVSMITRTIPSSGESIPVIGMGTWITFNVGSDPMARQQRLEVLATFLEQGGTMVDSSPMYGSAEEVLGYCIERLGQRAQPLFSATKVWTRSTTRGVDQIEDSFRLWGIERFDLLQVHNLLNWRGHLDSLLRLKQAGRLRYVGITTSHGRRHQELAQIMRTQPIDFVQLTYHLDNRAVEAELLPLAQERGIAVIANRPFSGGELFNRYQSAPLPGWAADIDCQNWAQFFLKFVISHPAITCAIPATSRVDHMIENMGAGRGRLPDAEGRHMMLDYIRSL